MTNPTTETLETQCRVSNNIQAIKKLVNAGVQPTQLCLTYASAHQKNIQTTRYLIEKCNLKPDINTLKSISHALGNDMLNYILEEFLKNNDISPKALPLPPPTSPPKKPRKKPQPQSKSPRPLKKNNPKNEQPEPDSDSDSDP